MRGTIIALRLFAALSGVGAFIVAAVDGIVGPELIMLNSILLLLLCRWLYELEFDQAVRKLQDNPVAFDPKSNR